MTAVGRVVYVVWDREDELVCICNTHEVAVKVKANNQWWDIEMIRTIDE